MEEDLRCLSASLEQALSKATRFVDSNSQSRIRNPVSHWYRKHELFKNCSGTSRIRGKNSILEFINEFDSSKTSDFDSSETSDSDSPRNKREVKSDERQARQKKECHRSTLGNQRRSGHALPDKHFSVGSPADFHESSSDGTHDFCSPRTPQTESCIASCIASPCELEELSSAEWSLCSARFSNVDSETRLPEVSNHGHRFTSSSLGNRANSFDPSGWCYPHESSSSSRLPSSERSFRHRIPMEKYCYDRSELTQQLPDDLRIIPTAIVHSLPIVNLNHKLVNRSMHSKNQLEKVSASRRIRDSMAARSNLSRGVVLDYGTNKRVRCDTVKRFHQYQRAWATDKFLNRQDVSRSTARE